MAQERTGPAEGEALRRLIEALTDAVQTARNYYALFHDDVWGERLSKWEAALAPLSGPVDASGEPRTDAVALVRYLTKRQREVRLVIEDYPQGGYQRELDIIETLLELVEGAAAVPSSPAQPPKSNRLVRGLASDIVLHVRRGVWHTTEVEQAIAHLAALPPSSPVADSPTKEQE